MFLPEDVERQLLLEYGPREVVEIMNAFEAAHKADSAVGARVFRCILYLAQGNAPRAMELAENARLDYRDVILWAEYDEKGRTRLRDFNKPV